MNKAEKNLTVPVWERTIMTLEEASAYSGVGIKKLRQITDEPTCDFVLWVGSRRRIKRKKLDEFMEQEFSL